jgi:GAF domain-containing protein
MVERTLVASRTVDGSVRAAEPENEAERLRILEDFEILDTPAEVAFDDLVELAANICQTKTAVLSLVAKDRRWFKARRGMAASETSRDCAFCAHAILAPEHVMQIPNALFDQRFATNPLVQEPGGIRFYAGAPLVSKEGVTLGTLCVIDDVPRELEPSQMNALRMLARQAMAQLELRRSLLRL